MFYGIITLASDNNNDLEFDLVSKEYDYHIVLKDLNSDQFLFFMNDKLAVFKKDHIHDIIKTYERGESGSYNNKYDVYIRFTGKPDLCFSIFQARYYEEASKLNPDGFKVSTTPLMTFSNNLIANMAAYILFTLLLTVISVFLLMVLYNIRINHYKFTYGIYMTYGAGFMKLIENSFWEMMLISLTTFLPASGLSYLINYLIYTLNGRFFHFYPVSIFKILIFSLIIAAASVLLPTWRLSRKTPMSLVVAEDNSNLVVSPRRSFNMLGIKFPKKYEYISLWRFRKYNAQLLLTSVAFSVLFMCALFYARMYNVKLYYNQYQFTINFTDNSEENTYNPSMRDELYDIEGIVNIEKLTETPAVTISSHIMIDKAYAAPFSNFVISQNIADKRLTSFVKYIPADEEIVNYLKRYDYEGDLAPILTDPNMIIVSDSFDNTLKFTFKPGDKIQIAKYKSRKRPVQNYVTGNEMLKMQLDYFTFDYKEYTICAVLKDNPTFENMPLYLNTEEYMFLTENPIRYKSVNIFIDQTSDIKKVNEIENELRYWAGYYTGVNVLNRHTLSLFRIEEAKNNYNSYIAIAYLILILSPLMWFFTQILFYQKRENEFRVLQAFGAIKAEIFKIFRHDGIFNAAAGTVICVLLNYGGIYVIYKFVNVILPKFVKNNIRYEFYMPLIPFISGLLIAVVCGFLSSYIPYITYNLKYSKLKNISEEFGEE